MVLREISEILLLWKLISAFQSCSKEWKENQHRSRGRSHGYFVGRGGGGVGFFVFK